MPILILVLMACKAENTEADDSTKNELSFKDSVWQVRNNFLSNPIFLDTLYQDSIFEKYEGLWRCVLIEKDQESEFPLYQDLFLSERKAWSMDYPCSWNFRYSCTDVHFKDDSIFFSTPDRAYIEKKKIQITNDTLALTNINKYDDSRYYVKIDYDTTILHSLKMKKFNPSCISGIWELTDIGDSILDTYSIHDGFLDHVPREINFSSDKFYFEDIYLKSIEDTSIKFELEQFERSYSQYYGESIWFEVRDLKRNNGKTYYYTYKPLTY